MPFSNVCCFLGCKTGCLWRIKTSIYTLFCPIWCIGKTTIGYKTLFEQIKTVCAWNTLTLKACPALPNTNYKSFRALLDSLFCLPFNNALTIKICVMIKISSAIFSASFSIFDIPPNFFQFWHFFKFCKIAWTQRLVWYGMVFITVS